MKKKHVTLTLMLAVLTCYCAKSQDKKTAQIDSIYESPDERMMQTDSTLAYNLLGHDYEKYLLANRWGDRRVAKNALYDMIIRASKPDSLMFSLAYLYYEGNEYASAALVCQELSNRNPKDINYLQLGASSLEAIGATDKAIENYEALYLLSDETTVLYKMASLQYRVKRYAEALTNTDILLSRPNIKTIKIDFKIAKDTIKKFTLEVAVFNLRGLVYENQKKLKKAKKAYKQALEVSPNFEPAKKHLAELEKT